MVLLIIYTVVGYALLPPDGKQILRLRAHFLRCARKDMCMRIEPQLTQPDPCPEEAILTAGEWATEKLQLLRHYVDASHRARRKWPQRAFVDLYCGPGRIAVREAGTQADGGALVACRQALATESGFTHVVVGDIKPEHLTACSRRLDALEIKHAALLGAAESTVDEALDRLPTRGLVLAYLDPFNLDQLPFSILRKLAALPNIDIAVHFSVMDLQREIELDFARDASRFEAVAPGWKDHVDLENVTKQGARVAFFNYWLTLAKNLGFGHAHEMPLITNSNNGPLYRMVFLMRHPLAERLWNSIAQAQKTTPDLFSGR